MKITIQFLSYYLCVAFITISTSSYAGWSVDSLAANRAGLLSGNAGGKSVFTNGVNWEVYDYNTNQWNSGNFVMARTAMKVIAADNKVYVAGGWRGPYTDPVDVNNIEVYNAGTSTWSSMTLSQGRTVGAAAVVGSKVIFAGGYRVLAYCTRVDFFDVNTNARSTGALSQARSNIAVGVAGSKVVFAGGQKGQPTMGVINSSNVIDVYNDSTGTWSTATLSAARQDIAVAVVGSKIIFAGGINMGSGLISKKADIYDAATGTWSVMDISQPKYGMTAAVVGTKAYFFGGVINGSGGLSKRVEIYDAVSGTWSVKYLSGQHHAGVIGQTGNRLMFAGGIDTWGNVGTSRIDVLNLQNGQWSVEQLSQPRLSLGAASYQNTVLFVGGNQVWSSYSQYIIPSKRIDKWVDNVPVVSGASRTTLNSTSGISLYPNPARNVLNIHSATASGDIRKLEMFDVTGNKVVSLVLAGEDLQLDLSSFANGLYIVQVREGASAILTERIVKE